MRILMLAQFYPPIIGGEEQVVRSLSIALAARGHDVAVVTLRIGDVPERETDQGVRIYRLHSTTQRAAWLYRERHRRHVPPVPDPELLRGLRAVIARERPAIVHAHNWILHSFLPLKRRSGARFVVTLHDYSLACANKRLMRHGAPCSGPGPARCVACVADYYGPLKGLPTLLSNWAMGVPERHAVDMFLPISEAVAAGNGLIGSGLPYRVLPDFVPLDAGVAPEDAHRYLEALPKDPFLLFVGDLTREKGLQTLLRAYESLDGAPPLVLIGRRCPDTPDTFPPGVCVIPGWPHHAVTAARVRSLLALVPSIWPEPFGLVAVEGLASGRPVIASRIGGLADIVVDGESGLLVPPDDADALGRAIRQLLGDRDRREAMGRAALARAEVYRAEVVVPQVEQVYRDISLCEGGD